jgi:hypothetical protein
VLTDDYYKGAHYKSQFGERKNGRITDTYVRHVKISEVTKLQQVFQCVATQRTVLNDEKVVESTEFSYQKSIGNVNSYQIRVGLGLSVQERKVRIDEQNQESAERNTEPVQASWGIPDEQNREPTNRFRMGGGQRLREEGARERRSHGGRRSQGGYLDLDRGALDRRALQCGSELGRAGAGGRDARWTLEFGPPFDLQRLKPPAACANRVGQRSAHLPRRLGQKEQPANIHPLSQLAAP